MWKHFLMISVLVLSVVLPALASDRDDDVARINAATQVFQEIMNTPDNSIPLELLETATKSRRRTPDCSGWASTPPPCD